MIRAYNSLWGGHRGFGKNQKRFIISEIGVSCGFIPLSAIAAFLRMNAPPRFCREQCWILCRSCSFHCIKSLPSCRYDLFCSGAMVDEQREALMSGETEIATLEPYLLDPEDSGSVRNAGMRSKLRSLTSQSSEHM